MLDNFFQFTIGKHKQPQQSLESFSERIWTRKLTCLPELMANKLSQLNNANENTTCNCAFGYPGGQTLKQQNTKYTITFIKYVIQRTALLHKIVT